MAGRRLLLAQMASLAKWLPYTEYAPLYNSLVPTTIDGKSVRNKARVLSIAGNSVVMNQDFKITSSNQSETINGITITDNRDGSYTFNGTATSIVYKQLGGSVQAIIGYQYLVIGGNGGSSSTYYLTENSSGAYDYGNGVVYTQPNNNYNRFMIVVVKNGTTLNNVVFRPQHICLTQLNPFVASWSLLTPQVQKLLSMGYIQPNAGEIVDSAVSEIESQPYNLFDGELTIGALGQNGEDVLTSNAIRSSNFIKVISSQTYTYEIANSGTNTISNYMVAEYDDNKNFIVRTVKYNNNSQFELSNNTRYVRFSSYCTGAATISGVQICFHRTDTRTGYAPHTQPKTLPFRYQGNGVGTSHDTLERTDTEWVFTKNIGVVDLGTLSWVKTTQNRFVISTFNDAKTGVNNQKANILCGRFTTATADEVYTNAKQNIIGFSASKSIVVYVNDTYYANTDAATFKTAMSGVYLYYELATPQVITIPRKHLAVVDLGSLTYTVQSSYTASATGIQTLIARPSAYNVQANIYCEKYKSVKEVDIATSNMSIAISTGGVVLIKDSSLQGQTAREIKSAMSGVYLFYKTQDEVADFDDKLTVEAGGTLNADSDVLADAAFEFKCR